MVKNVKKTVLIKYINKISTDKYNITMLIDSEALKFEITWGSMGGIIRRAIKRLGLDVGKTYPASIPLFEANLDFISSYPDPIKVKLEATDDSIIKMVNDYLSSSDEIEDEKIISRTTEYTLIRDIMPNLIEDVPYIKGTAEKIVDGDTMWVQITEANNVKHAMGEDEDLIGKSISIRLAGIECRETRKEDSRAETKNRNWLEANELYSSDTYDEDIESTYKMAEEAKSFLSKETKNKELTILIDNHPSNTMDQYERLIGIIYIENPYDDGLYSAINMNKSMLASESNIFKGMPLAESSIYYDDAGGEVTSIYGVAEWWRYHPDAYERRNKILEVESGSQVTSMEEFIRDHNLRLDNDNKIVYNEVYEKQIETQKHLIKGSTTLFEVQQENTRGNHYYTSSEKIAFANGYGNDTNKLSVELQRGEWNNKYLIIPIFKSGTNKLQKLVEGEFNSNINDIPADSQHEDYANPIYDDRDKLDGFNRGKYSIEEIEDIYNNGYTRIGDCTFTIPPLAIKVDSMAQNKSTPVLRSKSGIQTQSGHSTKIITMELFFSSIDEVNGYKVVNTEEEPKLNPLLGSPYEQEWLRNGLRPLIAQFKKAPFLPIENNIINDEFNIFAVALKDLQITTLPGFPGVMKATLSMYEFDHTTYMFGEEDFAGTFNWRMYRWYYQKMMEENAGEKDRTYLKRIDELDDSISFYILKEEELAKRKEAIRELDEKIDPMLYAKTNASPDTETGKKLLDGNRVEQAKLQKAAFDEWLRNHPQEEYPHMYDSGIYCGIKFDEIPKRDNSEILKYMTAIMDMLSVVYFNGDTITDSWIQSKNIKELYNEIYESEIEGGAAHAYFVPSNLSEIRKFIDEYLSRLIKWSPSDKNILIRADKLWFEKENKYDTPANSATGYEDKPYHIDRPWHSTVDSSGGFFSIRVEALENRIIMDPNKLDTFNADNGGGVYILSPSKDVVIINKLSNSKKAAQDSIYNYKVEYNELKETASMTELEIGTEEFIIGNDFWVENIAAGMSNNLVPIQLSMNESPTFQFLGSQDTDIQMSIRTTNKDVLGSFRELLSKTQKISRDYRIGITSGILSIKNNILGLLGIQDVLIQSISVETIPEDKESYRISITLRGFDKEQSKKEELTQEDISDSIDGAKNYYDYSKERRKDENFEYAAVDFALRDAELYPDMELPTYDELNTVLHYLDIESLDGQPYVHMYNPSGGKYLDPDFYIRSGNTVREMIADLLNNETPAMYLKDNSGFESVELGPRPGEKSMSGQNVHLSPETRDWIENNIPTVDMGKLQLEGELGETSGFYSEFYSNRLTEESAEKLGVKENMYSASNSDIKAKEVSLLGNIIYSTERIEKAILKSLSNSELASTLTGEMIPPNKPVKPKNPKLSEIAKEIERQVSIVFSNIPFDYELAKGRYATSETYTYGPSRISAPKITQQKISNVIKSLFQVESNWRQFSTHEDSLVPVMGSEGDLGISGININSKLFKNETDILKAAYDWKYNLTKGVEYFAWCYNKAVTDKGDPSENPLDWAIAIYENGKGSRSSTPFLDADIDNNVYYNQVINVLATKYGSSQALINATPDALVDEELITYEESKNRIDNLYKYLYVQTAKGSEIDLNNEMDVKLIKESIGNIVDVEKATLDSIKAIPVANPKKSDAVAVIGNINLTVEQGTRGKSLKDISTSVDLDSLYKAEDDLFYPIMAIDPNGEFRKAENRSDILPNLATSKSYQTTKVRVPTNNKLFLALVNHFEIMFQEDINFTEAEKESRKNSSYNYERTFDFTSNIIVIKEGAFELLSEMYALAKSEGKAESFNNFDIDWSSIYTLIDISGKTVESIEAIKELGSEVNKIEAGSHLLVDPSDIVESFRTAFNDMLEYDQRGRMVRAFPTFHMFLIHEGRWMLWHKMWDNFYGYNSISSIDIVKDRRIAADTAVIEMSNIYHNLNTDDDETSFGELDSTLLDIIAGDPEARRKTLRNIFKLPDEEIIRARAENVRSLILKPGARIHLRMGYGSNAIDLPVAFNGTITEMNVDEMCTVVAQGDGLELTNKLNVDPDATTDPGLFSSIKEPREMICEILTSKGGFFQNIMNNMTGGVFFNKHPLGITHFGNADAPDPVRLPDILSPTDTSRAKYGEAGVNVYSGAGYNTFSQWMYTHGEKRGDSIGVNMGQAFLGLPWAKGDEPSVQIYLFDKTPWDIFQIYSSICPDYIAAVHPFEYRSTLFFGRPHWGMIDKYEYEYTWDKESNYLKRKAIRAYRKSYSQAHIYSGYTDIIGNNIKASATNMYTNVIGVYNEADGAKKTKPVSLDTDIYPQFQRTAIVHMPIQATKFANYWTQEKYAQSAAVSELQDYVKEMYQGDLIVIGDPTVKPYDTMYMDDEFSDMRGLTEVKRVVHNMSYETGFVTSISPDCISIADDSQMMSRNLWLTSHLAGAGVTIAGAFAKTAIWKYMLNTTVAEALRRYANNAPDFIMKVMIKKQMKIAVKEHGKGIVAKHEGLELVNILGENVDDWKRLIRETSKAGKGNSIDKILEATNSLITKSGYKGASDDAVKIVTKVAESFRDVYRKPKLTGEIIDNIWDASKILNKTHWFKNKGVIRKSANFLLRNTSRITKVGAKVGTRVTASGFKGLMWAMKSSVGKIVLPALVTEVAVTIITSNLIERYQRYLKHRQSLTIMPLQYRGKDFTAGIDGHQGSVMGDSPSKVDKFFEGEGFASGIMGAWNFILGVDPDYSPDIDD